MRHQPSLARPIRIALAVDLSEALPWHYGIYQGVRRYLADVENIELVVDDFPHVESRNFPDGIIARTDYALAMWAKDQGIPLINVFANSPIAAETPTFKVDNRMGARLAAEHLYGRGFRRFCFITISEAWVDQEVEEAFRHFADERNCPVEVVRVARLFTKSESDWKYFMTELPATWKRIGSPFGIFVSTDCITFAGRATADLCAKAGLQVPLDVAIVDGKNGTPYCEESPSLTAVEWSYDNVGYEAAKAIHARIEKGQTLESRSFPPVGIVERDSTDYFATDDEIVSKAITYISEHFSSPLRVDEIADGIFVTRRTLERRFKNVTGRSVSAEIMRLRISKAKRMMANDELSSLKSIAHEVGFRDERRLYDAFRSLEGCSPSEFWGRTKPGS